MRPARPTSLLCLASVTALVDLSTPIATAGGAASDGDSRRHCVGSRLPDGGPARDILQIAEQAKAEMDLKSVILRVTVDSREVITTALGESMTGVPADPAMHFRNGNVAISYLGTTLLRLVDEGKAGLDDPVARRLPVFLHGEGDRITLRMLADSTSGLVDYVTTVPTK